MQQIVLSGQWAVWHRDPATVKLRAYTGVRKVLFAVKKKSGCKGNERGSPSLDPNPPRSLLSLLPETASLSPTAAKTVKHHTASMIFTYSPGLQHGEPQDVTNPAHGVRKRLKKSQKWWRGSKINLLNIWRCASSHLSPSQSLALSAPVNTATENLDLHIRMMKKKKVTGLCRRWSIQA